MENYAQFSAVPQSIITSDAQSHLTRLAASESKISPYWLEQLQKVEKPVARSLIAKLTPANPLGYESLLPNRFASSSSSASASLTSTVREGSLLEYTIQQKIKHPHCVILMRCGEFYETYGVPFSRSLSHLSPSLSLSLRSTHTLSLLLSPFPTLSLTRSLSPRSLYL